MAVGLFWNDRVSFEKHEWAKRFFFLGNNTGNLVFIRALKEIFHPVMIPLWDVTSDTFRDRADITHYITTELIWLTPNQTYPHVWTMLKRIGDKPLVPISVGVQSMARNVDITLHPDTVKLLRTMAERAVLGVRGEYTAAVLEKNGIVNFRIIGCPSLYQGMNEKFRVEKKPFDPKMRACCNFRTFYGTLSDPQSVEKTAEEIRLSRLSQSGSPSPAGSPETAHSTIPPTESSLRRAASISAFIRPPACSSSTGNGLADTARSVSASTETGSKGVSSTPWIAAICAPTVTPFRARSCIAAAPAKQSGAVSRPENCPPPRISFAPWYLMKAG